MSQRQPCHTPRPQVQAGRRGGGYSMVEILVTLSIVGILATLAYPAYRTQVQHVRRTDAQAVLMQAAQFLERYYTENGKYAEDGMPCPIPYSKAPIDGSESYYTIVGNCTGSTFTVDAIPASGGPEAGAGKLQIDDSGVRRWDRDNSDEYESGEDHW
jgi:type IV pilus assembly protein PilE